MASALTVIAGISSIALRILSYIFFRWIPGHPFPPAIYAFALTYYGSIYFDKGVQDQGRTQQQRPRTETSGKNSTRESTNSLQKEVPGHRTWWQQWLLGLPSPGSRWNPLIQAVNALLVLMTLDVVYTGPLLYPSDDLSFARLGYISSSSATILVREPNPSKLPIYLTYRILSPPGTWRRAGFIPTLSSATDYTAPLTLNYLEPDTPYAFTLSNNHSGTFTTAPTTGSVPSRTSKFTFLTTSCVKPGFPYSPLKHRLSIPGLTHLAALLPDLKAQFMLFLGDFIYIDVPHFRSSSIENYRSEYRRVYASPSWSGPVSTLPWLHVWDDHEISNDWDRGSTPPYPAARDPFDHYHHAVNPPPLGGGGNKTWYTFHSGPASFFLLDTRSYRSPSASSATSPEKSMLGPSQLSDLLSWLRTRETDGVRWKFVISSVPFTRNWRVNALDTWGGYLVERRKVLEAMWDVPLHSPGTGVVVLSGDRHEFAATRFPVPDVGNGDGREGEARREGEASDARTKGRADVIEFSTSPLSMFYLPIRTYRADTPSGAASPHPSNIGATYGHDEMIAYIPDGNSKFGAIDLEERPEIEGPGGEDEGKAARLTFRLFIDGKEAWKYEVRAPQAGRGGEAAE